MHKDGEHGGTIRWQRERPVWRNVRGRDAGGASEAVGDLPGKPARRPLQAASSWKLVDGQGVGLTSWQVRHKKQT